MERFEMAEMLRNKAGVSYEDARRALDESGWDPLQAMVILEQQGKLNHANAKEARTDTKPGAKKTEDSPLSRLMTWLKGLLDKGNRSLFLIRKNGRKVVDIPVTLFVLLLILLHGFGIFLLILGLVLGYQYSFLGSKEIEEAKAAAKQAETAAEELENWHTVNSMNV